MAADGESGPRRLGVALRVVAVASLVATLAAAAAADRDAVVTWTAAALGRERAAGGLGVLVTPERFAAARGGAVLLAAALSAVLWWRAAEVARRGGRLIAAARDTWRAAAARLAALPALERWTWGLLIGAFAVQRTVDALTVPLHPDEVTSFLALIRHGPLVALTVYTSPNNHVLHSVLSSVAVALPLPTTLAIRLTAIVGSTVALIALAALLRTSGRALPALLGVLAFSALPPVVYYGASGRGYGLIFAATALGIAATAQLASPTLRTVSRRWRLLYVLAGAVGVVAVPTHLYAVAALSATRAGFALADRSRRGLLAVCIDTAAIGLLSFIGFSGALLRSGFGRVAANRNVRSYSFAWVTERLPRYVERCGEWLLSGDYGGALIPLTIAVAALLLWRCRRDDRRGAVLAAVALALALSAIVFPLLQRVVPRPRAWCHVAFAPTLCIFLVAQSVWRGRLHAVAPILALLAAGASGVYGARLARAQNALDGDLRRVDTWLARNGIDSVYASSKLAGNSLRYHGLQRRGARATHRRLDVSGAWNTQSPEKGFAEFPRESPPAALVSAIDVPPPTALPGDYRLAFRAGVYGVWLRAR